MAVLTGAHRRLHFDASFTIVDVAGDDDFGAPRRGGLRR
jgi:hypothetical protein